VLLRWQAPQPCSHTGRRGLPGPLERRRPHVIPYVNPYVIPYALGCVPLASPAERISAGQSPFVGPVSRKNRG